MSELTEKIDLISGSMTRIETKLDTELPHLATKADLIGAIAEHKTTCPANKRPSKTPPNGSFPRPSLPPHVSTNKLIATIITAIAAVIGAYLTGGAGF